MRAERLMAYLYGWECAVWGGNYCGKHYSSAHIWNSSALESWVRYHHSCQESPPSCHIQKKTSIQSGYEYERKCVNVINRQNQRAILQTDWTHAWGFSLILVGSPDFLFFFFGCMFWLACMSFSSKSLEEWNSPSLRMSCSKTEYISHQI